MTDDEKRTIRSMRTRMLLLMNRMERAGALHIYSGTVPAHVREERREKNRRAKKARRVNR